MKKLITIILIALSFSSFGQGNKYNVNVGPGGGSSGGGDTTNNTLMTWTQANLRFVKFTDTASMLAAYQTALNARVKYSDTASMLAPYQTALNARVKYSDTATLIKTKYSAKQDSLTMAANLLKIVITNPLPRDVLTYDAVQGYWVNKPIDSIKSDVFITFPTRVNIIQSNATYSGTSGATWGNYALSDRFLPADGKIYFKYNGSISSDCMLAFNSVNNNPGPSGYGSYKAGVYMSGPAIVKIDNGGVSGIGANANPGDFIAVTRVGSTFKVQKSTDSVNWIDLATFTYTSSATMYINISINGTTQILDSPRGVNLL